MINILLTVALIISALGLVYSISVAVNAFLIAKKSDLTLAFKLLIEPGPKMALKFINKSLSILPSKALSQMLDNVDIDAAKVTSRDKILCGRLLSYSKTIEEDTKAFKKLIKKMLKNDNADELNKIEKRQHIMAIRYCINDRFKLAINKFKKYFSRLGGVAIVISVVELVCLVLSSLGYGVGNNLLTKILMLVLSIAVACVSVVATIFCFVGTRITIKNFISDSFAMNETNEEEQRTNYKLATDLFGKWQDAFSDFNKFITIGHDSKSILNKVAMTNYDNAPSSIKSAIATIITGHDDGDYINVLLDALGDTKALAWSLRSKDMAKNLVNIYILASIFERQLIFQTELYYIILRDSTMYQLDTDYSLNILSNFYMQMTKDHLDDKIIATINTLNNRGALKAILDGNDDENNSDKNNKEIIDSMAHALTLAIKGIQDAFIKDQATITLLKQNISKQMMLLDKQNLIDNDTLLKIYAERHAQANKAGHEI